MILLRIYKIELFFIQAAHALGCLFEKTLIRKKSAIERLIKIAIRNFSLKQPQHRRASMEFEPASLYITSGRQGRVYVPALRSAYRILPGKSQERRCSCDGPARERWVPTAWRSCQRLADPALAAKAGFISADSYFLEKSVDGAFIKMLIRKKVSGEAHQFHLISDKKLLSANF